MIGSARSSTSRFRRIRSRDGHVSEARISGSEPRRCVGVRIRVEAQLVQASGGGQWRFEIRSDTLEAGSLRVLAGEVALVSSDAVVFRMSGKPGERVVFTFRSR